MSPDAQQSDKSYRGMAILFMATLVGLGLFNLIMWHVFTKTLYGPDNGDMKRMGYLVRYEDCKQRLKKAEPPGGRVLSVAEANRAEFVKAVFMGDSFCGDLARAYSIQHGNAAVVVLPMWWDQKNGLSQIRRYMDKDWLQRHHVEAFIVERAEYEFLNTFADPGPTGATTSINQLLQGGTRVAYERREPLNFSNNGNFKVIFYNLGYLFSPTVFGQSETVQVDLIRPMFRCSYGNKLLFYKGDLRGALTPGRRGDYEACLRNIRQISKDCSSMGIKFNLYVPPSKSFLYQPWVKKSFFKDSLLLEFLDKDASADGYVDLKKAFRDKINNGAMDWYFPDDAHWTFSAAQLAVTLEGAQ